MSIDLILLNSPNLLPRDEVRIERVAAAPYPDRRRIKVEVEVTPFRERPNLEITITHGDGKIAASSSVISLMQFKTTFHLHLRGLDDPAGEYTVRVMLYYEEVQLPQDVRETVLRIPPPNLDPETST